jgi:hypothetical protein
MDSSKGFFSLRRPVKRERMLIDIHAKQRVQCELDKTSCNKERIAKLRVVLGNIAQMLAGDLLVAPVSVCQVLTLPDVRSKLGWIEFSHACGDGGINDGRLVFHRMISQHADHDIES